MPEIVTSDFSTENPENLHFKVQILRIKRSLGWSGVDWSGVDWAGRGRVFTFLMKFILSYHFLIFYS